MSGTEQLKLDKTATPEKEAAEAFENADDKKLKLHEMRNTHEINMLTLKGGLIGKIIGAQDPALNFCVIVTMFLLLVIIIFAIGIFLAIDQLVEPLRLAFTALLTIVGYVFGRKS